MAGVLDNISTLPRAAKWALAGVAFVGLYFLVVEPGLDYKKTLDARADKAGRVVEVFHEDADARDGKRRRIEQGTARFGSVLPPAGLTETSEGAMLRAGAERVQQFNSAITKVFDKHKVARRESSPDNNARLPAGPLASLVGADRDVLRMVREISFTAPPESVSAILSELESTPEISSISRVLIVRPDPQREGATRELTVTITAETWVVRPKGART